MNGSKDPSIKRKMFEDVIKRIKEMPLEQLTKELKDAGVKFTKNKKLIKIYKARMKKWMKKNGNHMG